MRSLLEDMRIQAVWEKGTEVPFRDPSEWRYDACRNLICRRHYGNRLSPNGWEMDHINPWGADDVSNLQPLQWRENVKKGQHMPVFYPQPLQDWGQLYGSLPDYGGLDWRILKDILDELLATDGRDEIGGWFMPRNPYKS